MAFAQEPNSRINALSVENGNPLRLRFKSRRLGTFSPRRWLEIVPDASHVLTAQLFLFFRAWSIETHSGYGITWIILRKQVHLKGNALSVVLGLKSRFHRRPGFARPADGTAASGVMTSPSKGTSQYYQATP